MRLLLLLLLLLLDDELLVDESNRFRSSCFFGFLHRHLNPPFMFPSSRHCSPSAS
jgi:hypothetical protein